MIDKSFDKTTSDASGQNLPQKLKSSSSSKKTKNRDIVKETFINQPYLPTKGMQENIYKKKERFGEGENRGANQGKAQQKSFPEVMRNFVVRIGTRVVRGISNNCECLTKCFKKNISPSYSEQTSKSQHDKINNTFTQINGLGKLYRMEKLQSQANIRDQDDDLENKHFAGFSEQKKSRLDQNNKKANEPPSSTEQKSQQTKVQTQQPILNPTTYLDIKQVYVKQKEDQSISNIKAEATNEIKHSEHQASLPPDYIATEQEIDKEFNNRKERVRTFRNRRQLNPLRKKLKIKYVEVILKIDPQIPLIQEKNEPIKPQSIKDEQYHRKCVKQTEKQQSTSKEQTGQSSNNSQRKTIKKGENNKKPSKSQNNKPNQDDEEKQQQVQHKAQGCNCNKTKCIDNYCGCYKRGGQCSNLCKCLDCENTPVINKKGKQKLTVLSKQIKDYTNPKAILSKGQLKDLEPNQINFQDVNLGPQVQNYTYYMRDPKKQFPVLIKIEEQQFSTDANLKIVDCMSDQYRKQHQDQSKMDLQQSSKKSQQKSKCSSQNSSKTDSNQSQPGFNINQGSSNIYGKKSDEDREQKIKKENWAQNQIQQSIRQEINSNARLYTEIIKDFGKDVNQNNMQRPNEENVEQSSQKKEEISQQTMESWQTLPTKEGQAIIEVRRSSNNQAQSTPDSDWQKMVNEFFPKQQSNPINQSPIDSQKKDMSE